MNIFNRKLLAVLFLMVAPLVFSQNLKTISVEGGKIKIEFNGNLYSRVISNLDGNNVVMGEFTPSEYIQTNGKDITEFKAGDFKKEPYVDKIGEGVQYTIYGISKDLQKKIIITTIDREVYRMFYLVGS